MIHQKADVVMKEFWNKLNRKQKNDLIIIVVLAAIYLAYRFLH